MSERRLTGGGFAPRGVMGGSEMVVTPEPPRGAEAVKRAVVKRLLAIPEPFTSPDDCGLDVASILRATRTR